MTDSAYRFSPATEEKIYRLYREFLYHAERKRRWIIEEDVPWDRCNPSLDPAVADVIESFCAVELFLPDYIGKILPMVRPGPGRAWFAFNWGYEESKHSLVLGDWLLRSGHRTEEQMADVREMVIAHEWNLPMDSPIGMACYSMVQELATWLHYRNLRQLIGPTGDPALHTLLGLISTDERAHYTFFRKCISLHLKEDRAGTLEQMRRVLGTFRMPAVYLLTDGRRRAEAVKSLGIFTEDVFYRDLYIPMLEDLGIERREMRSRSPDRKSLAGSSAP